jgi:ABC-type Mn2+/Zn2+ transport system permease subunit/Mn-dependent DtxR family transcriptional regulator
MTLMWLAQLEFTWSEAATPFLPRWWAETLCSALVGVACGVLGCFVVLRRMALIGDALSHAVLPGVVIAFIITRSSGVPGLLLGALLAGLATAVLINLVSRHSRTKEDSAIGIVFTALFAIGVILISGLERGTHFDLRCFLFGDPLAVMREDVIMMAVVCPTVVGIVALLYHRFKLTSFDPVVAAAMGINVAAMHYLLMGMLSATVVAGLKTTGVILVVAMVITPASAAYQLTDRFARMLVLAGLFGAASAVAGMSLAFVTNSPTGPAMVLVASAIFVACMLLSPSHGVVFDRLRRWRLARHIAGEDVLKAIHGLSHTDAVTHPSPQLAAIASRAQLSEPVTQQTLARLRGSGLVGTDMTHTTLTSSGLARAEEMVRSHRLWESYLANQADLSPEQVHELAEKLEHAHELADEVDATLGYPQTDPHGSPIPPKPGAGSESGA